MPLQPVTMTRKFALFVCALLYALLLTGCGWRANGQVSREGPPQIAAPGLSSISSITATANPAHEPTYVVYARAVDATAQAIVSSLPTPSPIPNLRPDLEREEQRQYLWRIALPTAVALVPTLPPDYDPWSEKTPLPRLSPFPTEAPYPSIPTANGKIYNRSLEDNPEGKMLGTVNYWVGKIGGSRTLVFAGHATGTPSQGIIIVETPLTGTLTPDGPTRQINGYQTPTQVGAVRIIHEAGGRFTLQAADSSLLYFDISSRQWVSPPPTPVRPPTAAP